MTAPMSPIVRRLVAARRLDPAAITGTGEDGRITRRDVHLAAADRPSAHGTDPAATNAPVTAAVAVDFENVERVRGAVPSAQGAVSFLPFVLRAVCDTVSGLPCVNASIEGDALVVRAAVHPRVVLEIGSGQVVTGVIRDANTKSLLDLGREVRALVDGDQGDAATGESAAATFTVRQSCSPAATLSVPVLDGPQVAMLSIDAIGKQLVVAAGPDGRDAIAARRVGVVSLTWDHRAFDGAYGSSFVDQVRAHLEQHDWAPELGREGPVSS